jgi:hypothetical protein
MTKEILNLGLQSLAVPDVSSDFYDRSESLAKVRKYINGVSTFSSDYFIDKKFSLLGTSGMAGIGKTQLLLQIGATITSTEKGDMVRSTYISFNGGTQNKKDFRSLYNECRNYDDALGQLLLKLCNVPERLYHFLTIEQSIKLYRTISKMADDDVLLILIDEIGHLEESMGVEALKDLMSAMDAGGGKLIFIFTHIMTEFLAQLETASGRKVDLLPLPHLEIDIWRNIPDLSKAARDHPALHQLFLSCSGHPRSIFDGIKNARKQNPSLLTDPTSDAISLARETIIQSSKFQLLSFQMLDIILKWFSLIPLTEKELIQWRYSGLLHTMKYVFLHLFLSLFL